MDSLSLGHSMMLSVLLQSGFMAALVYVWWRLIDAVTSVDDAESQDAARGSVRDPAPAKTAA
jgi:hypothetical protein